MWEEFFRRWHDWALWWLPRSRADQARAPDTPPATAQQAEPHLAGDANNKAPAGSAGERTFDDLTRIKGIGRATQERLRSFGIMTFQHLAAANPDDLADRLKTVQPVSKLQVSQWIESAQKTSHGGAA
jgi:predicted flap endonuclease-1-like 5' DNA nuclease